MIKNFNRQVHLMGLITKASCWITLPPGWCFSTKAICFYRFLVNPAIASRRVNPITSGFAQAGSAIKNPFSKIDQLLREAERLATEFVQGLYSLKDVSVTRLDEEALNALLVRYLKLSFDEDDSGTTPKLNREVYNDLSGLVIGEKKANVITMTGQGSEVFASIKNHNKVTSPYTFGLSQQLQFPHIVTQCLLIEDTERELKSLDFERKAQRFPGVAHDPRPRTQSRRTGRVHRLCAL